MLTQKDVRKIVAGYDLNDITIGTLGGHSALDVCRGAKDLGFKTVVVCQKGREKTYSHYYRARQDKGVDRSVGKGVVDNVIVVDKFADITNGGVQEKLRKLNTIFIHSRYFWVYCNFSDIENKFSVPIFGTRALLRAEERDQQRNQYFLLEKAGIRTPKRFSDARKIDRLAIVKASEAARSYERGFFFAGSYDDYAKKSRQLLQQKAITPDSLKKAVIEEFIIGPQINLNFFYSPLTGELELLGTDTRRQTNIDGLLRLTAPEQLEALKSITPKYIESGHIAVTMKESLLEKAFEAGERFVAATKKFYPPGIIGPFALQAAVSAEQGKEEFVVFDCSLRIPGSPGTRYTPYGHYLYGEDVSVGKRIAMEVKKAAEEKRLGDVLT
ncbi:formate--phosphoribosylaminoimidazolecarboxamide ligase family protein [Candidatus Woesearchaeota archaeon]|nr:formate--phosphoribosylaminoimidazolecarboxamide ligase family protein [Candidatus Woesearchaeota archaeon]